MSINFKYLSTLKQNDFISYDMAYQTTMPFFQWIFCNHVIVFVIPLNPERCERPLGKPFTVPVKGFIVRPAKSKVTGNNYIIILCKL